MTRLLVVSSDSRWRYYLEHGLGRMPDMEVEGTDTCTTALDQLQAKAAGHFSAVLIDGAAPTGCTPEEVEFEIGSFVSSLRGRKCQENGAPAAECKLPVLLWSSYPADGLSRIASRFESTLLLSNDTYEAIGAALAAVTARYGKKADYACVELEIGPTSFNVRVSVEGKGVITQFGRTSAWRPTLQNLEEKFRTWALLRRYAGQQPRYADDWRMQLEEAGQRLAEELNYNQLGAAVSECLNHVDEIRKVHFRFCLLSSDVDATFPFVNVPFELLYDSVKKDFVRLLSPVARRMDLRAAHRTATSLAAARTFPGRLLFIKSDAHGSIEVEGTTFGGQPQLVLPKLAWLDREFDAIATARGVGITDRLDLKAGTDCVQALQDELEKCAGKPAEMVHFSGHSVRSDDGSVYLVLPGYQAGQLRLLPISDFADWSREAKLQLVILSSCESSRPDSVFRLAQVGIPAAIGFRWEVADGEAAYFTGKLHDGLAKKVPLARAFHAALSEVRREYLGSPTFASPMLVIQDDEWTC